MNDNIIKFPGVTKGPVQPEGALKPPSTVPEGAVQVPLTPDQEKAIGLIMSGMPFVFVGIKPMDSGADFFTALHGEPSDLRNAQDHLPAVIQRLFMRKGIL